MQYLICLEMVVYFVVVKHTDMNMGMVYSWTIDVSCAQVWSFTCGRIAWNVTRPAAVG